MSELVSPPTLQLLLEALKDFDDWFVFGAFLGVPVKQLRKIESSHLRGDFLDRCKIDMLQYWLDNNVNASWKDVARALEQIDQLVLATAVKHKYLLLTAGECGKRDGVPKELPENTASSSQPSTLPPANPPTAEEIEAEINADVTVLKELQELENIFYYTTVRIMRCLIQLNCDLSEARVFLNGVTGTDDFKSCEDFTQLMQKLQRDYIDIFNISKLQGLVTCFDKKELTQLVEEYEKKMQSFLKKTTVLSFQHTVASRAESVLSKGKAVLTIKIPEKMATQRTLKDVEELAREGFEESYKSLVQLHVKAGSIIISWIFPEALSGRLEQVARDNAAIFKDAGVEEVTVGGRRVYPDTPQKDIITSSQEKSTVKQVYIEFYHKLVEAVSDPHTFQSLAAQLHSTTLIPQEKIAKLSSGQTSGSEFLKVLGVEEEPHLLTVLMEKMGGMEQLQKLAKQMTVRLRTLQHDAEKQILEARIGELTSDNKVLHTQLKEKDELLTTKTKLISGMATERCQIEKKGNLQLKENINQLEEEVAAHQFERKELKDNINQLGEEVAAHQIVRKELKDKINQLEEEVAAHQIVKKELKEKIKQLEEEVDARRLTSSLKARRHVSSRDSHRPLFVYRTPDKRALAKIFGVPTDKKWYHGSITDAQAEYRLRSVPQKDGTYLMYDNPAARGEYILLVTVNRQQHRWRIVKRGSDGMFVLGEATPGALGHESVRKLIKYHRGVTGKPIMLKHGGRVVLGDYAYVDSD